MIKKLSFMPNMKYLCEKCNKAIHLLGVISHKDWGADRQMLLKLYRTLVRSKLDYGYFISAAARKSCMKELDAIHHQSLWLILGAYNTSLIESLYAEAHELPFAIRLHKLALQYYTKFCSCPNSLAYSCVFQPQYKELYNLKENLLASA